jgi:hypothetical protein
MKRRQSAVRAESFLVTEAKLSDGSPVYSVRGPADNGAWIITIDCNSAEEAHDLARMMNSSTCGVSVRKDWRVSK